MAYIVSANSASLEDIPIPAGSTTGMSKIVDYHGQILCEAATGSESMVANATIDLAALRAGDHYGLAALVEARGLEAAAGPSLAPGDARVLAGGSEVDARRGELLRSLGQALAENFEIAEEDA